MKLLNSFFRFLMPTCPHQWSVMLDPVTGRPKTRECRRCGKTQRAEIVWKTTGNIYDL